MNQIINKIEGFFGVENPETAILGPQDGATEAKEAATGEENTTATDESGPTDPAATEAAKPIDTSNQIITRLDHARNLPEVIWDAITEEVSEAISAIQSFKSHDRRTMRVVLADGVLSQQEI